jgi:hypothetical protein
VELRDFHQTETENPMTDDRLPLAELAAKSGDSDFLRAIAESVLQLIMEADVDGLIGAGRYERGELLTYVRSMRRSAVFLPRPSHLGKQMTTSFSDDYSLM